MKIACIVPGSGGTFYCENCLRDTMLVKALRAQGHDAMLVPLYLPMFSDETAGVHGVPVFFGGINVYLQQRMNLFRHTPRWLDRVFDAPPLLRLAARRAGTTRANGLGAMTLSMLRGRTGNQSKELDRLISWLATERPDIVHISNTLLIGLVRDLKARLGIPVVCSLQDEDTWLDALDEPYNRFCWDEIVERALGVDAFIAVSRYYANTMQQRLSLPADKVHVVRIGIDPQDYPPTKPREGVAIVGFLSRLTPALGVETLLDAFIQLRAEPGRENLRLSAVGGIAGDDARFLRHLRQKAAKAGLADAVSFSGDVDGPARRRFLASLSLLCVPMAQGEAYGTFLLEGWAARVPAVMPAAGAFPELIEVTGGGLLYDPADPEALPSALRRLLDDPLHAAAMGRKGREAVEGTLSLSTMADATVQVYQAVTRRHP